MVGCISRGLLGPGCGTVGPLCDGLLGRADPPGLVCANIDGVPKPTLADSSAAVTRCFFLFILISSLATKKSSRRWSGGYQRNRYASGKINPCLTSKMGKTLELGEYRAVRLEMSDKNALAV